MGVEELWSSSKVKRGRGACLLQTGDDITTTRQPQHLYISVQPTHNRMVTVGALCPFFFPSLHLTIVLLNFFFFSLLHLLLLCVICAPQSSRSSPAPPLLCFGGGTVVIWQHVFPRSQGTNTAGRYMNLAVCKLSVCVLAPGFTHVQYSGTLTQIATDSPNIFAETGFFSNC